jgi:alpha-L-rhamnosidase
MYSFTTNKSFFIIFISFLTYKINNDIKPIIKAKSDLHIYDLKINHLSNPLGIDITKNSFSFLSDRPGPFKVSIISKKTNQIIESQKILLSNYNSFCFKKPLEYQTSYIYRVEDSRNINELEFETALKLDSKFISPKNKEIESPIFIKEFNIDIKNIIKARLYITGLGLYQAFINDKKVGKGHLTPGYNDYDHYLRYQTYNIDKLIKENSTSSKGLSGNV